MKLKYKYSVHSLVDAYPTEEDVLFDVITFLKSKNRPLADEWSDLSIKGAFSKKLEDSDLDLLLDSLVKQKFLTKRSGAGKRSYYTIISDPFE